MRGGCPAWVGETSQDGSERAQEDGRYERYRKKLSQSSEVLNRKRENEKCPFLRSSKDPTA